jgi:signal transduction histidine kinase/DNA-binding response OmpR family regulator/streptogramin lyase
MGVCVAVCAHAQIRPDFAGPWVHESWTVRDGLPVNGIGTILQSRDGYLWATTLDGLVRYDGARFTVFNASVDAALPTNRFNVGVESPDGALWFRTEDLRLVRYRHGRFTNFDRTHGITSSVSAVARDSSGEIWIGTNEGAGVIRGDRFVPVGKDTVPAASSFLRRRDGTTWIGTFAKGIYHIGNGPARLAVSAKVLDSAIVWSFLEDSAGAVWIGTSRGLWLERDGTLRRVETTEGPRSNVYRLIWSSAQHTIYAYTAQGIYRAKDGRLARVGARKLTQFAALPFALDSRGVAWYAIGAELFRDGQRVFTLPREPESAEARVITGLLFDREGGIWLATSYGLDRITPAIVRTFSVAEGLAARNVYPVRADSAGNVWVGTWGGGLSRIDTAGRVSTFAASPEMPGNIHSIAIDSAGRAWVIGNSPLAVCQATSMRCRRDTSGYASEVETYALYIDRSGRFWAGVRDGLLRHDATGWRRVPEWKGTHPVRAFLETRDGALWIGTNGDGIARWEGSSGRFDYIRSPDGLPSDLVRSLYEDAHGTLWIGMEGRGLAALDPLAWQPRSGAGHADKRIRHVGARDGLYDETIHQILSDDAGRFWMNTNRGVFWVRGEELHDFVAGKTSRVHATSYTERDGLNNREGNGGFFPAGAKTRDGRLWFPTQDGVVMIDPARLSTTPLPPAVVERIAGGDSALAIGDERLVLDPRHRNLQVDYTASIFVDPSNVRFRYRLEPYDRDWIDAGNRRTAFYTRVPPGSYRFRVEVGSSSGTWNEAGEAGIDLTLASEFWETSWFRAGLVAAFVLALVAAIRWRVAHLRQQARDLELVVADRTRQLSAQNTQLERQTAQLAELDRAKTRFFANVSHEFRTPLTLTIGPLEDMRARAAGGGDAQAERWLDIALRNARRLLRLVNQILDVTKLEAGQMKLARRRFDVVPFARGVAAAFETVALQRRIALVVTTPPTLIGALDPDAFEKILTNLLSNALKFTPQGGRVTLGLGVEHGRIVLKVADTGPGILASQAPFVFERFYQADESANRTEPGTGIGLSLVKELVELHGGTIQVASGEGIIGTTFTVALPIGGDLGIVGTLTPGETPVTGPAEPDEREETVREDNVPTLLVVDDSADLRAWVREHFSARFRVYEAGDGADGIALAREHLPDMVISDVMMPGVDGFELCRTLRSSPETDFLPIVLLTAHVDSERRIEGLERGADDYLTKPFAMRELEARVDNLVALRRRLRERFATGTAEVPHPSEIAMPAGLDADDRLLAGRVRAAIEANLADPDFGVAELAKAVFQDRSHLFRRTKQIFGISPSDLIRQARVERGARLLEAGAGTVTDVAYAVGFNKVSHFCRVFQETYGATPAAWRSRLAERSATSGA